MKTRYTFLNYMAKMSFWGVLSVVGVTPLTAIIEIGFKDYLLWGLMVSMTYNFIPSLVIGILITPIIAVMVVLFVFIFFPNPNPDEPKFQITSIMIVSIMGFVLGHVSWNISLPLMLVIRNVPDVNLLHAIFTSLVLTFVHYRALPQMFSTVQKRKEK